ncbi:MAG: ABC transporter permease [Thermoproteota archaeon]
MREILLNLLRRKVRVSLTIFGIAIGIFALTVMGSMAEYFNLMVERALRLSGNSISVSPRESGFMPTFGESTIRRLKRIEGVKEVIPIVYDSLGEINEGALLGITDMVLGVPPEQSMLVMEPIALEKGRWLEKGDDYQAVIGHKIAVRKKLGLGDKIVWKKKKFTVVGIMERTETPSDQIVIVPIETARRLMKQTGVAHSAAVIPVDPSQGDALADRINREISEVRATPPKESLKNVYQSLIIFNAIMLSGAVLAIVVGGLSVINTMIMSVHERTREIGLKKAVGAEDLDILAEYVLEAAIIGLLGGVIGLTLGWAMANILNKTVAGAVGGEIFVMTPRLALGALVFAILLGILGGLYPAWKAARLDPVIALRSE